MDRQFSEYFVEDAADHNSVTDDGPSCYQEALNQSRNTWWNYSKVRAAYKFVHDSVLESFAERQTIGGRSLQKCFTKSDGLICSTLEPLYSRYFKKTVGPGLTHHETCHVIFMPVSAQSSNRETIYQLHSLRVLLTGDRVETECLPLPFSYRLHAAARLMERGHVEKAVLRQVGLDLTGWAAMLRLAEKTSLEELEGMMVLPAYGKGGLLIGHFIPDYPLAEGSLTKISASGALDATVPRDPLEASLFEVSTFYGDDFITPSRQKVRSAISDWRQRHQVAYDKEMADLLWPGRQLSRPAVVDYYSTHAEELEVLLADQEIANTIAGKKWSTAALRSEARISSPSRSMV